MLELLTGWYAVVMVHGIAVVILHNARRFTLSPAYLPASYTPRSLKQYQ
jgi:hypothetical protein